LIYQSKNHKSYSLGNMLPLLTSSQIREADAYTIAHEPVDAIPLTDRATQGAWLKKPRTILL
jgi:hypothetical protein